jgi:hypothetical protein
MRFYIPAGCHGNGVTSGTRVIKEACAARMRRNTLEIGSTAGIGRVIILGI